MKIKVVLIGFIFILSLSFYGCGGSGPGGPGSKGSEKTGVNLIVVKVVHKYLDNETAWQIDFYLNPDCDNDPTTTDPEPFSDDFAVFTFKGVPLDEKVTPGNLHIETYTVEFFPQDPGAPPIEKLNGYTSFTIIPDGNEAEHQILIIDVDRKVKVHEDIEKGLYSPQREPLLYDMVITFKGKDDYGNEFEVAPFKQTIEIGNYDHCG